MDILDIAEQIGFLAVVKATTGEVVITKTPPVVLTNNAPYVLANSSAEVSQVLRTSNLRDLVRSRLVIPMTIRT